MTLQYNDVYITSSASTTDNSVGVDLEGTLPRLRSTTTLLLTSATLFYRPLTGAVDYIITPYPYLFPYTLLVIPCCLESHIFFHV